MDPLLPSEVAMLVLRYLVTNDCTESVAAFLTEMPWFKGTFKKIPTKLELPPVFGSLTEILNDYGRSKLIVRNLVTKLLMDWKAIPEDSISPCDTLITQLRQINLLLSSFCADGKENSIAVAGSQNKKTNSTTKYVQTTSTVDASVTTIIRTKRIASTCTSEDNVIEGCWSTCTCLHVNSKIPPKVYVEIETQTEFFTSFEDMDVHVDNDVHSADNMEADRLETNEEREKNVVCTLIHNVLDETNHDILLGLANSVLQMRSTSDTPQKKEMALHAVFSEADSEVDNFLRQLLCGESIIGLEDGELCDETEPDAPPDSVDEFKMAEQNLMALFPAHGADVDNRTETSGSRVGVNSSIESNNERTPQSSQSQEHAGSFQEKESLDDVVNTQLPIPETLDKIKTVNQPVITAPLVIETNNILPRTSAWQRLGRRTIAPKIPSFLASVACPVSVQTLEQPNLNPLPVPFKSVVNSISVTETGKPTPLCTLQTVQLQHPAVKVTATNDNESIPTANHSPAKSITATGASPLLKRLITISQNICIQTPESNALPSPKTKVCSKPERKSYSTPRKKHVRNIQFLTPPNLKNKNPDKDSTPVRQLAQDSSSLLKKAHIQKSLFPPFEKAAPKEVTNKIQDSQAAVPPSSDAKMPEERQKQNLPVRTKRKRKTPEKHISLLNQNEHTPVTAPLKRDAINIQEVPSATLLSSYTQNTNTQPFMGDSDFAIPRTPRYKSGLDSDWESQSADGNSETSRFLAFSLPTHSSLSKDGLPITPGKNLDIVQIRRLSPVGERKEVIAATTFESKSLVSCNHSNVKNVSNLNVPFYVAGRAKQLTTMEHDTINGLFRLREGVESSPVGAQMFTPRSSPVREIPDNTLLKNRALTNTDLDHFLSMVQGDSKSSNSSNAKKTKLN